MHEVYGIMDRSATALIDFERKGKREVVEFSVVTRNLMYACLCSLYVSTIVYKSLGVVLTSFDFKIIFV